MKENKDKKPNKTAVAISYDPSDNAPRVIATGKGYLGEKIINKAMEEDIPLYQDQALAGTLSKLELGSEIPPELYDVVAEILVFVGNMDEMKNRLSYE